MTDFVHLHNHSDHSLLDGAQTVDSLIDMIGELKMDSVAITEHGNLFSMVPFYKAARKAGIRPIIGCEAYIARGDRREQQATRATGWGYNHLVLLAQNQTGLHNLVKLVSIGYLEGFYYRPRIDKELLQKYGEGLICLSGCLKGEVQEKAVRGDLDGARKAALELAGLFPDRFYLEVQQHGIPEEDAARAANIKLSRELGLPLVATNDCHYARQPHWEAHDIMFCLGTGKNRDDPNRQRYATPEFYFKSADSMYEMFKDIPQALENTVAIAEQCSVELDLGNLHLPQFPIPADASTKDPNEYLRQQAQTGLEQFFDPVTPEIQARLDGELKVIKDTEYAGYFLIVMDFIRYARGQEIPVGPGRGSAAGSLVAYALGITTVNPIEYNLLFERFLNAERVSMPDIDIDFCQERRGEVIDYVKRQYGENAVSQIITFGKLKARSVVRDVARVLGMSYGEADRLAKMIPDSPKITIDKALSENPELAQAASMDQLHEDLFSFSRVLEGMNRHASTHAAGVVIAPGELTDYVALYKNPKTGEVATQADMNGLEDLGLLKMDFLGLRTLTVIDKTVRMLWKKGTQIEADKLPLDDKATYELFSRGQTTGIFQFESTGMREFLKKLRPTSIADLIAMNALYRPGPMAFIDEFIDRKHGRREISYPHAALESILKETYGIIIYQEQVMEIAHAVAGFSLSQADIMRRAMGKKKAREMHRLETDFLKGAEANGFPANLAKEVFELMARFASYGFNKSHSTAYALVAYQTAYLKAHHPAEFMAATLSSEMTNPDRIPVLLAEARRMKLEVLPPDVNHSGRNFRVDDETRIIFGLNAIKNVGQKAADHIKSARKTNEGWSTLAAFVGEVDPQVVNRRALECLVKSGACDSLEGIRSQKFAALDGAMRYAQALQTGANPDQESLFGEGSEATMALEPPLPAAEPWTDDEQFEMEKELTGFYLSGHPLSAFEEDLAEFTNYGTGQPGWVSESDQLRLGGIISNLKMHQTKKGTPMAFFTLEGLAGHVEVVVFSDVYARSQSLLTKDAKVFVSGRPSTRGQPRGNGRSNGPLEAPGSEGVAEEIKVLAEDIIPLEGLRQRLAKRINIKLSLGDLNSGLIQKLRKLSDEHRGSCELWLHIKDDGQGDRPARGPTRRIRSTDCQVEPAQEFLNDLRRLIGKENVWVSSR